MPRIIISEPGKSPQPYRLKLTREETKIGRGADNDIIIEAGSASTHHCAMKRVSGGFILEDLQSTNGIKIDDSRHAIIDLTDGMIVHIGDDVTLEFTLSADEIEELGDEDFTPHHKPLLPPIKSDKKDKIAPSDHFISDDEDDDDDDDDDDAFFADPPKKQKSAKATAAELLDDEEEEFIEKAVSKQLKRQVTPSAPAHYTGPQQTYVKSSSGTATIIFLILAAAAFIGGMIIRNYQDNGTFLFDKAPTKTSE